MTIKNFTVYETMPEGWTIVEGATMAPQGYVIISNGKSRFGGERQSGIMPINY